MQNQSFHYGRPYVRPRKINSILIKRNQTGQRNALTSKQQGDRARNRKVFTERKYNHMSVILHTLWTNIFSEGEFLCLYNLKYLLIIHHLLFISKHQCIKRKKKTDPFKYDFNLMQHIQVTLPFTFGLLLETYKETFQNKLKSEIQFSYDFCPTK